MSGNICHILVSHISSRVENYVSPHDRVRVFGLVGDEVHGWLELSR